MTNQQHPHGKNSTGLFDGSLTLRLRAFFVHLSRFMGGLGL